MKEKDIDKILEDLTYKERLLEKGVPYYLHGKTKIATDNKIIAYKEFAKEMKKLIASSSDKGN